ncbi:MAG: hypothetical protein MUP53_05495 [Bacteroidales bacterium]|nr:hypothetical protein [Bacteroidales bacterium]
MRKLEADMGRLKYYVIHCSDTPPGMEVTRGMLEEWHLGPINLGDGRVKYKGRTYRSRQALPKDFLNGNPIAFIKGRGWDRLGYSAMIHRNGFREILTPYNEDEYVQSDEMTWGAAGYNAVSRHIMLVGGKGSLMRFTDHFTEDQENLLLKDIKRTILHHPDITILGHNQLSIKRCPGFDVYKWLQEHRMQGFGVIDVKKE